MKNLIISAPVDENVIALTFDDGPAHAITSDILDTLGQNNIKATFFVCGSQLEHPQNVKQLCRAYAEGHTIASHTYSHPYLTQLSDEQITQEMNSTANAIHKALGVHPLLMRPPYG